MAETSQQCNSEDQDIDVLLSVEADHDDGSLVEELDDAYAYEYFHKFEPDPIYDRDAPMPEESSAALRQYCIERGLSYIRRNGIEEPARQIKEACICRRRCYMKFLDDVRSKLLNNLLGLSTAGQIEFFSNHITVVAVHTRKSVRIYHLPSNSGRTQVCMRMFANTFDLSDKKLRIIHDKILAMSHHDLNSQPITEELDDDDATPLGSPSNCDEAELQNNPEADESPRTNINFIEIPQMRNLGDMEEYFLRYETDVDFHSRTEREILQSRLGKETGEGKRAERRYKKAKGYRYIRHDGTEAPARKLKPRCSCTRECRKKISNSARQMLLNNLLNLSIEGQENFLYSHMPLKTSSKRRVYSSFPASNRGFSDYFLPTGPTGSELIKVCRVMFINTYDTTDKKVRRIRTMKRRENQNVLDVEDDNMDKAEAGDFKAEFSKKQATKCEEDTPNYVSEDETDDAIEIDDSYDFVKSESESESDVSKVGMDDESDTDSDQASKNPERTICTVVSSSDREPAVDDAFLDEYFHRYESTSQKEPTKNKDKWTIKCWSSTDADEMPNESCNCVAFNCSSWFTDDLRQKMFKRYSRLSPWNKKRFLHRHIRKDIKQRNKKNQSRRTFSRYYFLPTKKGHVKVCKTMFMNTFKATDRRIRSVVDSKKMTLSVEEAISEEASVQQDTDDLIDADYVEKLPCDNLQQGRITDTPNYVSEDETDDAIEIDDSYDFVKSESESESDVSRIGMDEESDTDSDRTSQTPERNSCTVVSSSDREPAVDDAFLDEYFHRYESTSQKELTKNKDKWTIKCWSSTDADEMPNESCNCVAFNCSSWFTDDLRQKMFKRYSRLSPWNKKRFLYRHIRKDIKQRNKKNQSRRTFSRYYFLPTKKGHVKVCKTMFMNTFKATDRRIRSVVDSKKMSLSVEAAISEEASVQQETDDLIDAGCVEKLPCDNLQQDPITDTPSNILEDETESECESMTSKIGIDEESDTDSNEASEISEQHHFTIVSIVSNSDSGIPIDDAFLEEYFHRYESNWSQKELSKDRNKWMKKWWPSVDEDEVPNEPCNCEKFNCSSWFTDKLRQKIFTRFSGLSPSKKALFLSQHIRKETTQRSKIDQSRRSFSMYYFIPTKKGHVKVCKVMFMNTFKVTDRRIRTLMYTEKMAVSPDENTSDVESIHQEPDDPVDAGYVKNVSCHDLQQDTIADDGENSSPLETLINDHFQEGNVEAVHAKIGDEMETNEVINAKPEDGINENSMAVDEELDYSSMDQPVESIDQSVSMFEGLSDMEAEIDDVFLNQYFHRYETNFGQEEPPQTKDKAMGKRWSLADADEIPESCTCTTFNCSSWFKDDLRQKLYTRYAGLSILNKKRFLYRHIRRENKRTSWKPNSRRNFSMFYYVPTKKGYAKVCKIMFMNTFKVSDKKLRLIIGNEKFSDPSDKTTNEEPSCSPLDPDDFLIDVDERFLGESSNSFQPDNIIETNPESCSTATGDMTESCNEDDNLPANDVDTGSDSTVTKSKQLPVVELDEQFLNEYFARYEANVENQEAEKEKPWKNWIKPNPSNTILPPCSCSRICDAVFPDDVRRAIYTRFAALSSLNQKRFLYRHIRHDNVHRKRCRAAISRRQNSWSYYLPANSGHIKVCKVMYMNTLQVTEKKLRLLVQRRELAEHVSNDDDPDAQHISSQETNDMSFDDINEAHNYRAEIDNQTEELPECQKYFAQVAESAVDPLLSILGCSVTDNAFSVAELEENFLDGYFQHFGGNVAVENRKRNAPKIFPPIACACHRKCHTKFPDKIRQLILGRFAGLSNENRIRFLTGHAQMEPTFYNTDGQSAQSATCCYYLPSRSGHVKVCNVMFLNTFSINEDELLRLISRNAGQDNVNVQFEIKTEPDLPQMDIKEECDSETEKSETEMIVEHSAHGLQDDHSYSLPEQLLTTSSRTSDKSAPKDRNERTCVPESSRQIETNTRRAGSSSKVSIRFAKEHICSFPRITSHFCEVANKTKYLSCLLDVTRMYIAYIKACTESSKEPVPSKVYSALLQKERTKDPVLLSVCDSCQYEENVDPDEDSSNFLYEDEHA